MVRPNKLNWKVTDVELPPYKKAGEQKTRDLVAKVMYEREEFLEDAIAGLLAAGVSKDEISIHYHTESKVTIEVNGVEKYCHQINFNDDSTSSLKD